MARYAISQEGADAMRHLAENIRSSAEGMNQAATNLQNSIMGCIENLGVYGFEIWNLTLHLKALLEDRSGDIDQLAEGVSKKAAEIMELIGLNQPSSTIAQNHVESNASFTKGIDGISGWIKDINPNYSNPFYPPDGHPYHSNCGSCAFAVESRLQGKNDAVASIQLELRTDGGMEKATGKKCVYMSPDDIAQKLISMGPGAHLICGINRHAPYPGHWFNAYYDGNKIYTIDGQVGEIYDWPHDYVDVSEWCALV